VKSPTVYFVAAGMMTGLPEYACEMAMPSVYPSAGLCCRRVAMTPPPAPVRLSTITGWPSACCSVFASTRPSTSVLPAGAEPM